MCLAPVTASFSLPVHRSEGSVPCWGMALLPTAASQSCELSLSSRLHAKETPTSWMCSRGRHSRLYSEPSTSLVGTQLAFTTVKCKCTREAGGFLIPLLYSSSLSDFAQGLTFVRMSRMPTCWPVLWEHVLSCTCRSVNEEHALSEIAASKPRADLQPI